MINLCFDHVIDISRKLVWPNLIPSADATQESLMHNRSSWSSTAPWVDYPRVIDYLTDEQIDFDLFDAKSAPRGSLYLVNICWFDHSIDYFDLMSEISRARLRSREIKFVIIYGEADSALKIQRTIFKLCDKHNVNPADIHVVLGNSMANLVTNFHFFDDDQVIYQRSQQSNQIQPCQWHDAPRQKKMTLLSRVHKSWRAYFCSWYWHHDFHKNSYFSYRMIDQGEDMNLQDNPLRHEIKTDSLRLQVVNDFLSKAPFAADELTDQEHNYYGTRVSQHYSNSYWNCVIETHLCLEDNLPGSFITEKTWKAIAQAQPFLILGTAGSLAHLHAQGYETFESIGIDESYDSILDPTARFNAVFEVVKYIHGLDFTKLHLLNRHARDIVEYNQQLYWQSKKQYLENLFNNI
jgi:hypothetical protein